MAEIIEANLKNGKDGTGEPDPERPQLEMVYEMKQAEKEKNKKFEGSRVWSYVMLPGHPSYDRTVWKLDQLLLALGVSTNKKRKGTFDPDDMVGEEVVVNVRPDTNLNGEYRGQIGSVMAYDEETFGQESDEDDDEELDEEDLEETEEDDEEEDDEEEDDEDEDEVDDDEEEVEEDDETEDYSDWSIADLRAELKERELSSRGPKPTLIERLEEDDASDEEEEDEEDEEEEEEPTPRKRKSAAKKPAAKAKSAAKRSPSKRAGGRRGKSGDYPFDDE